MSLTLVFDMPLPLAVSIPAVKKYFISKIPCGVCIYFPETARLTVVSWTPTARAWLQPRDAFQRLLHVIHVMVCAAGNFRDAPLSERLHKFVNDAIFQSV